MNNKFVILSFLFLLKSKGHLQLPGGECSLKFFYDCCFLNVNPSGFCDQCCTLLLDFVINVIHWFWILWISVLYNPCKMYCGCLSNNQGAGIEVFTGFN